VRANLPGWSASVTQVIGVPEPTFRVIVNRSRVYPPGGLARRVSGGLARRVSGGLARRVSGGLARRVFCPPSFLSAVFVAEWPADHLMTVSFT